MASQDPPPQDPPAHDQVAAQLDAHPARNGLLFNVVVTLVEVGGSIALFQLARRQGAGDVASYLIGSIAPLVGGVMVWARARKFSGASASIFAFTMLSALIALVGSTTPKVLLYKDCATTALIGLLFLASCVVGRRPLVFYMAQRYATDGTHDGMAVFDTMWTLYRDFRRAMFVISYLWAALFLVQAGATTLIIQRSRYARAYTYDQILPVVATALGILGSVMLGRYFAQRNTPPDAPRSSSAPHDVPGA